MRGLHCCAGRGKTLLTFCFVCFPSPRSIMLVYLSSRERNMQPLATMQSTLVLAFLRTLKLQITIENLHAVLLQLLWLFFLNSILI